MEVDEVWRLFHSSPDQLLSREELRLIQELDVSIQRIEEHAESLLATIFTFYIRSIS
jgi:hypothetical protein